MSLIERQAAIDAIDEISREVDDGDGFDYAKWREYFCELPSAKPKTGRWIKLDMHRGMADHKCTACEQECYVPTCMGEPMYAYCPNCGADMRGEQDDKCRQV